MGTWHRQPRTTAEIRAVAEATEQGVVVRAKRVGHNLPNAWDDIPREKSRSWKRHRKTRWK